MPFDVFIQALTEQLDRAQASMALKARVAKLPLTFAVKDVSLDLRAFVQLIDDDVFVRPAGPGDTEASTIKLTLTTITRSMVEENAVDFKTEEPQFELREAMHGQLSDEDQRRLERIGVRTVEQLTDLRKTAGADVVARLARMPVNRLQQALLAPPRRASPRCARRPKAPPVGATCARACRRPAARRRRSRSCARPADVPVVESHDGRIVLAPDASQLGLDAEIDFGDGHVAEGRLSRRRKRARGSRSDA